MVSYPRTISPIFPGKEQDKYQIVQLRRKNHENITHQTKILNHIPFLSGRRTEMILAP